MRNKNKTPNNKTLSIKKAVRMGNCKVFAKKILPPDKKTIINARSVEIFFAKLCINLVKGRWRLIFV